MTIREWLIANTFGWMGDVEPIAKADRELIAHIEGRYHKERLITMLVQLKVISAWREEGPTYEVIR